MGGRKGKEYSCQHGPCGHKGPVRHLIQQLYPTPGRETLDRAG
jgi:hypothetical protein